MKKIILVCLCIMLLVLGAFSVMAAADMAITLKADKQILMPGDQITIFMEVQAEKECTSFGVKMIYDENVFEVVGGSCKFSGAFVSDFNPERGFVAMYLAGGKPKGEVGKVTLQVRPDASAGEATFTGKVSIKDGDTRLQGTVNTLTFQIVGDDTKETQPQEMQQTQPQETQQQLQETQGQQTQEEQQTQTHETQSQPTQPTQPQQAIEQTSDPTQATEQTQWTTVETLYQEQNQSGETTETNIIFTETSSTVGQTAEIVEKKNDILLIAVIAVVVVAAVAVGGYFVLKKRIK